MSVIMMRGAQHNKIFFLVVGVVLIDVMNVRAALLAYDAAPLAFVEKPELEFLGDRFPGHQIVLRSFGCWLVSILQGETRASTVLEPLAVSPELARKENGPAEMLAR
jgi:hypothetical protein